MATGSGAEVSIVTSQRSPAVPLVSTVSASRTMSGYWRALMPMPSAPIIAAPVRSLEDSLAHTATSTARSSGSTDPTGSTEKAMRDHVGATGRHVDHEVGERRPALLGDRLDGEQAGEVAVGLVVALADQLGEAAAVVGMAERRQAAERREQPQDQRLAEVGPFGGEREVVAPGVTRDPPAGGADAEVEPAPRVGDVER